MSSPVRRIPSLLLCCAILASAGSAPAQSRADLVISSGAEGGSYAAVASRVRVLLTTEHHYSVETVPSAGSMENLSRLGDPQSPVGAALAQGDALSLFLRERPDLSEQFLVLADIGKECVFVITSRDSGIANAADLKRDTGNKISVGSAGSGAAVTYTYMTHLDPEFGRTGRVNIGIMESLAQLKSAGQYSSVKAALLVQRPRIVSQPLEIVLANPETYRVIPIRRGDLTSPTLPDGGPVYTFERVEIRKLKFDTICTRGLLLASKTKVPEEMREKLAQVLLESMNYISPGK